MAGVQVQVLQFDFGQAGGAPGVELGLDGLADAACGRLRQRRLRSQRLGQGRLHVAGGQAAYVPADHQRLQRVGAGDVLAQQPGRERDLGAAQLGPLQGDRPGGGLDGDRLVAVAVARPGVRVALVAVTAEEHADLGLQRALQHQPEAQASDLLQDLGKRLVGGEQLLDLAADTVSRR